MAKCVQCGQREAVQLARCKPCVTRLMRICKVAVRNINKALERCPSAGFKGKIVLLPPRE